MPDTQIIVIPMATIKEWYQEGDQPSQEQFWATFDSLYHKHEGAIVRHPTEAEVTAGNKTFEILTIAGPIKIPASGNYPGSIEDVSKEAKIYSAGELQVFKIPTNTAIGILEVGDYCIGFVEGTFISANYLGGDIALLSSFDI